MEKTSLSIKEWAREDRPREKMLLKGLFSLSDAELLAILIGSGNSTETAVELSQRILRTVNNDLNALGKLSINELITGFKGIGEAKAVTIAAALELGRRRRETEPRERDVIRSSQDVFHLLAPVLCDLPHEELWVILTNRSSKVIDKLKIAQGGISEASADIRLILKAAITSLASGIFVCHNHPSGNLTPSRQDDALTERLQSAARLMDMILFDHLILAENQYYSYADEGKLGG